MSRFNELANALDKYDEDDKQRDEIAAILRSLDAQPGAPIDMVLFCPACGMQHIDAPEEVPGMPIYKSAPTPDMPHRMEQVGTYTGQGEWKNPPHRSHLCHDCGHIWRPADVPTNGVKAVKTVGKADSPIAAPVAAQPTREQIQRERMGARQWNAKAFDFAGYFAALQRAMHARNATPADVSRATGVSATTLTRMKEGRRPDAASLAALSAWAGLNPAAYVKASPAKVDFDLPAQSDEVAAQPTELEELRKLVKDFPLNDRDVPIIYDTNEIDLITYALTGDDGEDDSVTVLQRLVRALPGKTVYNLLEEAETAAQPQQANWNAIHDAQQRYLPLIKAAVDLIAQCHLQLETLPVPQCYGVPYGHINALREALQHVNKQAGL